MTVTALDPTTALVIIDLQNAVVLESTANEIIEMLAIAHTS
ncbi:hypothetical protein [Hamadaea tsunoensis]|nr:hypothetical protein [Hamadaea tsunoensis]